MNEKVSLLNNFFSNQEEVELLKEFSVEGDQYKGGIKLNASPKEDLSFNVIIPLSYPLSNDNLSARFICTNQSGFGHLNGDNSVCTLTPKHNNFLKRLSYEIEFLREWRDKYYLKEEVDDRYDYLIFTPSDNNTFLFTNTANDFRNDDEGSFNAFRFIDNSYPGLPESKLYYIQKIGSFDCNWSETVKNIKSNFTGFYYYIGAEPILRGNNICIDNWKALNKLISASFREKLYKLKIDPRKDNHELHILIGYNIPKSNEVHWQMIRTEKIKIPIQGRKVIRNYYEYDFIDAPIHWNKTFNCSYDRFFGRGAITKKITEKKILIMGVGALGSSLAKVLVRGGAKYLSVCDKDTIEPGNICRSEYRITNISTLKVWSLFKELVQLSPFVDVEVTEILNKRMDEPFKSDSSKFLNSFDYVFDCTTDTEISYYLDQLKIKSKIINMTISNKANELVCVVGGHNITKEKFILFEKLNHLESEMFYEGTGCWNPTFKASFFDLNCLLNLAIKNIDRKISETADLNSFIIKSELQNNSFNLKTIDY